MSMSERDAPHGPPTEPAEDEGHAVDDAVLAVEPIRVQFEPAVRYEGIGQAEFKDPHGVVAGPAWVEFDEAGVARGALAIQQVATDERLPMGLWQLFHSDRPVADEEPGSLVLSIGLESTANPCVAVVIQTEQGTFTAHDPVGYSHKHGWLLDQPETTTLTFQLFNGVFLASEAAPKYWVLPLTNFVSQFRPAGLEWAYHPLRLRVVPEVQTEGPWQDQVISRSRADQQNHLIVFEYKGRPAFIEPLLDYADREQRLKDGRDRRLVTALMVGELPADVRSEQQLERYLRPDLLHLLALATGSELGAPWVELRDGTAGLVARVHTSFGKPHYAPGHRAIDEAIHGGTGTLLTHGATSGIYESAMLRVMAKHLVRGGLRVLTVEDRLSHLIRALDGLCKMLGVSGQVSVTDLLTQQETGAVRKIVNRAARDVRKLADQAKREGQDNTAAVYQDVTQRISKPPVRKPALAPTYPNLFVAKGCMIWTLLQRTFRPIPGTMGAIG